MTAPRVSVLMTVYNGERYLAQAVESVLAQTFTDFEFLIRDDGSTDGSAALLRTYAARDPRLVLHLGQPNLGIVRSMNSLFPLARGQYLNRHDADDVSLPERLARQVAFLDAHPSVGVLGTPVELIDDEGAPIADPKPYFSRAADNPTIQEQLLLGCCFCQGSVLFRRACLEQVGLYDQSLQQSEDYDLWLRLAEITQLANLSTPLYRYRRHAGSISRRRSSQQALNGAQVIEKAMCRRNGPTPPDALRLLVAQRYLAAALAAYAAGAPDDAQARLTHIQTLAPRLLLGDAALAEEVLNYAARYGVNIGLAVAGMLFKHLPRSPRLARLRQRVLGSIHMREVFEGARLGNSARINQHLWAAVRHDPVWLRNRGVIALLGRSVLRLGPRS